MRFLILLFTLFLLNNTNAQEQLENTLTLGSEQDSLHFYQVLDSVKALGTVDSTQFIDLRLAAIYSMHRSNYDMAYPFLNWAYKYVDTDTVINTLLYESLIMKIGKQKDPKANLEDIFHYRKNYSHLKDSLIFNEVAFHEATVLLSSSFETGSLKTINNYYDIAITELNNTKNKEALLRIPNTEIMFFNVALKNYLAKNSTKCKQVLKLGRTYFPKNKDMLDLQQYLEKVKT